MDSDSAPLSDRLAKLIPTRKSIILQAIAGIVVLATMFGLIAHVEPEIASLSLFMSMFGMSLLARSLAEILPARKIRTAAAALRSAEQSQAQADTLGILRRARPGMPAIVIALVATAFFLFASFSCAGRHRTIFDVNLPLLVLANMLILASAIAISLVSTRIKIEYWIVKTMRNDGTISQMPLFYRFLDRLNAVLTRPIF
ncbi:MAG TPA: hypothetical protein VM223_10590 [Planctomycetota bacterium]|nr:hypothetical protein [Planctomycetota bacterium]